MDEKELRNELEHIYGEMADLINAIIDTENPILTQKSKKTEKKIVWGDCRSKALYATLKYGCSGLKDKTECLSCEFRR